MIHLRKFLLLGVAALVGVAVLGASTPAHADFTIRATDVSSAGLVSANVTQTGSSNADGSGMLVFSSAVGNFSITLVTDIATTGPGFTSASETVNITYTGPIGASSDKLIVEVLGNKFGNPTTGTSSTITSNASPSTSGLAASSVTMTSGVVSDSPTLNSQSVGGAPAAPLSPQLGTTTGTGSMGNASSVLTPNPVTGAAFSIPSSPFSFYQTFTFNGFTNTNQAGSLSAGSTVSAVPEPGGIALVLTGLSAVAGGGLLRRRKAVPSA
jgi:hypothetical protein